LCNEIFAIDKKTKKIRGVPDGCDKCEINDNWQCENGCMWPTNAWKYIDISDIINLYRMQQGGLDLNRLESLHMDDFVKVGLIKKFMG
jgi:hypothetical protein